MKITIDSKYHIWECAAQDDFRPVFTCVLIDPAGYAVAADGYIMGIVPATIEDGTGHPVLIHKDVVKKSKGSTMTIQGNRVSSPTGTNGQISEALREGTFPNWRKLIPDGMDVSQHGQTGPLDPRLTVRIHEAMGYRKRDKSYPWYLSQSKTHPTVFFGNGAYAMQMPIYSNPPRADKEVQSLKDLAQPAQPATSEPIAVAS